MRTTTPATIAAICTVAGLLVALGVLVALPAQQATALAAEGGLIENLSVLVAAIGTVAAFAKTLLTRKLIWGAVSLMLLWMCLRELDFQKLFTPRSVESIGFYSNPEIALSMKLTAVAALTPFAMAGLYLAYVVARSIRKSPAAIRTWLAPACIAAGLIAAALVSEKLLPPSFHIVEETAELAFLILIAFIVLERVFGRPEPAAPTSSTQANQPPASP